MFYRIKDNVLFDYSNAKYAEDCLYTEEFSQEDLDVFENKVIVVDGELVLNPNFEEEQIEAKKAQFNKDFFKTSLGYVRRKVSMATGETKDFLSDLLPTISMGVQMGQPVTIIVYSEPDFSQEIINWEALQSKQTVTAEFVRECFMQLSNDFKPIVSEVENVEEN